MLLKALLVMAIAAAPVTQYVETLANGKDRSLGNWDIISGDWKATGEHLAGNSGSGDGLIFFKTRAFTNFAMECKVRVENREGSLVFRAADKQNLYILVFNPKVNPDDQGSILLIRRVKGKETYFAGSEQYIKVKEWLKLKVICEGKRIDVYVNDKLTVSVEDANHESGFVGLRVFGDFFNGCKAQFKDFSVKALEAGKK